MTNKSRQPGQRLKSALPARNAATGLRPAAPAPKRAQAPAKTSPARSAAFTESALLRGVVARLAAKPGASRGMRELAATFTRFGTIGEAEADLRRRATGKTAGSYSAETRRAAAASALRVLRGPKGVAR